MLFTTPTQFAVLALCLIAGWFFGLASHPGGRKWKDRLHAAQAEHDAYRKDAEARINALEAERDRLVKVGATSTPVAATTATAAGSTATGGGIKGFFGWGRDNLARIAGVGLDTEARLNAEGIKTYHQIETMSERDEAELESRLALAPGIIAQQKWREQAAMLRDGRDDDHGRDYGDGDRHARR